MHHQGRTLILCLLDRIWLLMLIGDDTLQKSLALAYLEPIFEWVAIQHPLRQACVFGLEVQYLRTFLGPLFMLHVTC